jgi:hypothetical protein
MPDKDNHTPAEQPAPETASGDPPPTREAQLRHQLRWLGIADGQLIELQTLNRRGPKAHVAMTMTVGGAVRLALPLDAQGRPTLPMGEGRYKPELIDAQGIYIVPNGHVQGMESMLAGGRDRWQINVGDVTRDDRIGYRRSFYIDGDTTRINGLPISATQAELDRTLERGTVILADLLERLTSIGVDRPDDVVAHMMSGNGFQLHLRLANISNKGMDGQQAQAAIETILCSLGVLFDDDVLHIDTTVIDSKRICPLAGTQKRKAANDRELGRLHRVVTFRGSPDPRALTLLELVALAEAYRA